MFTTRTHTVARAAAVTAVLATSLVAVAGFASAAPQDASFLSSLDQQGITYDSPEIAINAALHTCSDLDAGATVDQITAEILDQSDLSPQNAEFFIVSAVTHYCPEYL
ncbi:DUF732 domain-containing protein [Rhodococcus aetherivorans]